MDNKFKPQHTRYGVLQLRIANCELRIAHDLFKRPVASIAILGDERPNWRPSRFGYQLFGSQVQFNYQVVKLLDGQQNLPALSASRNPFAFVVMAHLKALETRDNRLRRKQWKFDLTRRLYEQGYDQEAITNLFAFIDWIMSLPLDLEQEFWQDLRNCYGTAHALHH